MAISKSKQKFIKLWYELADKWNEIAYAWMDVKDNDGFDLNYLDDYFDAPKGVWGEADFITTSIDDMKGEVVGWIENVLIPAIERAEGDLPRYKDEAINKLYKELKSHNIRCHLSDGDELEIHKDDNFEKVIYQLEDKILDFLEDAPSYGVYKYEYLPDDLFIRPSNKVNPYMNYIEVVPSADSEK